MSDAILIPMYYIEMKPGSNKPRVANHGITVQFLAVLLNDPEWSVDHICQEYHLTPAQVHGAWAYYYDHKAEIDHSIQQDVAAHDRLADDPVRLAKLQALKDRKQRK